MIRISQEELFEQIKQEHSQLLLKELERERQERVAILRESRNFQTKMSSVLPKLRAYRTITAKDKNNNTNNNKNNINNPEIEPSTTCAPPTTRISAPAPAPAPAPPPTTTTNVPKTTSKDEDEIQAVLITGCGSKIGSNIAVAFAAMGLKVALVDFNSKQTEQVASECQEQSPRKREPLQIVADISQLDAAHKVIDRTIEAFGRLDVLVNTVNNASLMEAKFNGSGDDDPHVFEQYHKIIANNMHAVTYLCISAAPFLRKSKGTIINVSSIESNETGSYKFAYCMSKAGISTLTKCLATDLAPDIKVYCVTPKED